MPNDEEARLEGLKLELEEPGKGGSIYVNT
jgi:hypothetical protein